MIVLIILMFEGYKIEVYYGIVVGEVVMGVNVFKDFFVFICDIVGGCFGLYEEELIIVCKLVFIEFEYEVRSMGVNVVVGIDLDY